MLLFGSLFVIIIYWPVFVARIDLFGYLLVNIQIVFEAQFAPWYPIIWAKIGLWFLPLPGSWRGSYPGTVNSDQHLPGSRLKCHISSETISQVTQPASISNIFSCPQIFWSTSVILSGGGHSVLAVTQYLPRCWMLWVIGMNNNNGAGSMGWPQQSLHSAPAPSSPPGHPPPAIYTLPFQSLLRTW